MDSYEELDHFNMYFFNFFNFLVLIVRPNPMLNSNAFVLIFNTSSFLFCKYLYSVWEPLVFQLLLLCATLNK